MSKKPREDNARTMAATRKRPTQARALRTQNAILEAARTCLNEEGYNGAHIKQIAQAAGVSVGAIYEHFRDKRSLLLEVGKMEGERLKKEAFAPFHEAAARQENLEDQITPQELVQLAVKGTVESHLRYPRVLGEVMNKAQHDADFEALVREIEEDACVYIQTLLMLFQVKLDRTEARKSADFIVPMVSGGVRHFAIRGYRLSPEQIIHELTFMINAYLFSERSPELAKQEQSADKEP